MELGMEEQGLVHSEASGIGSMIGMIGIEPMGMLGPERYVAPFLMVPKPSTTLFALELADLMDLPNVALD
jgi:hypothetical protein